MGKKSARWARPDINDSLADLHVSDEVRRGDSVRALCPCHGRWEAFEQHITEVLHSLNDPSPVVRAQALHVFDEAARMQLAADLSDSLEPGETKLDDKRASARFRSMQDRIEARRDRKLRKHKGRRT